MLATQESMVVRFVVITRDNDGLGYRVQLRSRLAGNKPDLVSSRTRSLSEAKHDATRFFGGLLRWQEPDDIGLSGQPYVVAVAEIEVQPRD